MMYITAATVTILDVFGEIELLDKDYLFKNKSISINHINQSINQPINQPINQQLIL